MDWILSITTIVGMLLIGNKSNKGNALLVVNQGLWAWFAVSTNNKGLLPLVVALFIVYGRNWWLWRQAGKKKLHL